MVNHVAVRDELQDLRGPGRGEDSGVLPDRSTDLGLVVGDVGDVDVGGFGERGEWRAPILVAARKGRRGPHLGEELLVQGQEGVYVSEYFAGRVGGQNGLVEH